jgi:hypothetical protein
VVRCEFIFLDSCGMIPFSTVAGLNLSQGPEPFHNELLVGSCHEFCGHFHH